MKSKKQRTLLMLRGMTHLNIGATLALVAWTLSHWLGLLLMIGKFIVRKSVVTGSPLEVHAEDSCLPHLHSPYGAPGPLATSKPKA